MFSPFDYLLWAVVIALEFTAAALTFPRQKALSSLLWFRAAADSLGLIMLSNFGLTAFRWEDYLQRMIQFPLLGIVAVCCAGAAAGDSRGVKIYSGPFAAVVAIVVALMHGLMPWTLSTVVKIEQSTVFLIAAVVALALIVRKLDLVRGKMEAPWGATSAGLLILLSSYGLGWKAIEHHWVSWMVAGRGMQIGTILALSVWLAGPMRKIKLSEFRVSLGQKIQDAQRVSVC